MQENIPLKYPVVLVHGVVAHDRAGKVKFWGRIPATLSALGADVFFGNTDAWGSYESNALTLKNTIEAILKKNGKEKVNIIAHSKGGIDSRYLIWNYNFGDKVASLSTICTPHSGSEIADLLHHRKIVHTKLIKKVLKIFGSFYGDANPDLYRVNCELTTENMRAFNKQVLADEQVFYQSLYVTMNNAFDDIAFFYSYLYLRKVIGQNDGVVSAHSAHWGENTAKIASGISHAEILDIKQKKISGVHIPNIYIGLIKTLAEKDF
jgi:triacylglycerol lipase